MKLFICPNCGTEYLSKPNSVLILEKLISLGRKVICKKTCKPVLSEPPPVITQEYEVELSNTDSLLIYEVTDAKRKRI